MSKDNADWRRARLERVVGYVCALAEHYGNRHFPAKIKDLLDWEDHLTVSWRKEPTEGELEFFDAAWTSPVAGGNLGRLEHIVLP